MPVRVIDDDGLLVLDVLYVLDVGVGFVGDFLVQFATFIVVLVDVLASLPCCLHAFRKEQFHRFPSVHHSAGSVDARSDLEDDVADGDLFSAQSADVDDAFQSEARIAVDLFQSVVGKNSVFAGDGNDVRSNAHSGQFQ